MSCGLGTRTRELACRDPQGVSVDMALCSGTAPADSLPCNA